MKTYAEIQDEIATMEKELEIKKLALKAMPDPDAKVKRHADILCEFLASEGVHVKVALIERGVRKLMQADYVSRPAVYQPYKFDEQTPISRDARTSVRKYLKKQPDFKEWVFFNASDAYSRDIPNKVLLQYAIAKGGEVYKKVATIMALNPPVRGNGVTRNSVAPVQQ